MVASPEENTSKNGAYDRNACYEQPATYIVTACHTGRIDGRG